MTQKQYINKALNIAESEIGSRMLSAMSPLTGTPATPEQIKMGAKITKTGLNASEEVQQHLNIRTQPSPRPYK